MFFYVCTRKLNIGGQIRTIRLIKSFAEIIPKNCYECNAVDVLFKEKKGCAIFWVTINFRS